MLRLWSTSTDHSSVPTQKYQDGGCLVITVCACNEWLPAFLSCNTNAVYDDQGNLMGELGPSTPNLLMALPLPLYSCWAHVLLTAAQLKQWEPAKRAASILLPQFIVASPARPIWQEHPMDRHQLQMQQVSVAPVPLLRLLVLAVYVYAGHLGQKLQDQLLGANGMMHTADAAAADDGVASKLAGTAASRELLLQCSESQVPGQVALLEACKRIIAAMQVSRLTTCSIANQALAHILQTVRSDV